jgi:poly(glycerol-phosphate) alpha-glucosyltransferase
VEKRGAAKAIVVHSIFQEDPYDPKSGPNAHYRHMCENPAAFEGIVFVTGAAREDFCRKYGHRERTHVIPHPYPYEIKRADFDSRDHRKAVMVTRFDAVKQIGLAIDIFAMAAKKLPDIRLEIYGFGPEREKYLNQVKLLGLEKNVFIMGATDDPAAVFSGAAMSVMTSMAEGFGIAMAESLCCGCPVFAFDIKYGPSDIVKDGQTGFLFKPFGKEPFAGKIARYFEDTELQKAMSENAYGDAPRFGKAAFLAGWRGLTESARRQ